MGIGTVFIVSDVAFLISICFKIFERGEMAAAYTLLKSYLLLTVQKKLSPLDYSFVHILKKLSPLHCSFVDILKNEVVEYNKEG